MGAPIAYPLINGARHSFASVILKVDGQEFSGFKSINYSRTRERSKLWGPNPDPLGKTRGKNDYKCDVEIYLAEFKAFILDHFGAGYGDIFFSIEVTYSESGFDTQTDLVQGCTIDSTDVANAEGTDGSVRKFDTNPIKILFNGVDDNGTPLQGAPAQA